MKIANLILASLVLQTYEELDSLICVCKHTVSSEPKCCHITFGMGWPPRGYPVKIANLILAAKLLQTYGNKSVPICVCKLPGFPGAARPVIRDNLARQSRPSRRPFLSLGKSQGLQGCIIRRCASRAQCKLAGRESTPGPPPACGHPPARNPGRRSWDFGRRSLRLAYSAASFAHRCINILRCLGAVAWNYSS